MLNAFGRPSESFITDEILGLESQGLALRLYSVRRELDPHALAAASSVRAPVRYLRELGLGSGRGMPLWLLFNLLRVLRDHATVAWRHPLRWLAALVTALTLAWGDRRVDHRGRLRWRKSHVRDFLHAGQVAADLLRTRDVGHLHCHFSHGLATVSWLASRMSGVGWSFAPHLRDLRQPALNPGRLLERKLASARFVVAATRSTARLLRARHPRPADVHCIQPGIDRRRIEQASAGRVHRHRSRPLVVAAAGASITALLDAAGGLRDRGLPFSMLVVGGRLGSTDAGRRLIERRGLAEWVRIRPPLAAGDWPALLASASVVVLPSPGEGDASQEGLTGPLLAAMGLGVPVVAAREAAVPEVLTDGVHGLLVDGGSGPAIAEATALLLGDGRQALRLGDAARRRVAEHFDARIGTAELHALFRQPLDRRVVTAAALREARA